MYIDPDNLKYCGDSQRVIEELKVDKEKVNRKIKAMVLWLEDNQSDVFMRGLWDVINDG